MAKKETASEPVASKCPITKEQFKTKASFLSGELEGQKFIADKKEFSTGSVGWYFGGKITVIIDGIPVKVQVGINLTVVGSKDAK